MISEAKAAADEREAAVLEDAEKRANSISERAASSADIEIKRKILSKKQEIIANTIKDAKQKLKELDDEKYFDVVGKLLVKYKTGDAGEIVFSAKDKKRIPKDFPFLKRTEISTADLCLFTGISKLIAPLMRFLKGLMTSSPIWLIKSCLALAERKGCVLWLSYIPMLLLA